jgi:hypothetical protein
MSEKSTPVKIHYEEDYYYINIKPTENKKKLVKKDKPYSPLYEENVWQF